MCFPFRVIAAVNVYVAAGLHDPAQRRTLGYPSRRNVPDVVEGLVDDLGPQLAVEDQNADRHRIEYVAQIGEQLSGLLRLFFLLRDLAMRLSKSRQRGCGRSHVPRNATVAEEGSACRKARMPGDRDPAAVRLASVQLVDEVAERAPCLEIGDMCSRAGTAL